MKEFRIRGSRHLDLCLRLLYTEGKRFMVDIVKNDKNQVEYSIKFDATDDEYLVLLEKYETFTR